MLALISAVREIHAVSNPIAVDALTRERSSFVHFTSKDAAFYDNGRYHLYLREREGEVVYGGHSIVSTVPYQPYSPESFEHFMTVTKPVKALKKKIDPWGYFSLKHFFLKRGGSYVSKAHPIFYTPSKAPHVFNEYKISPATVGVAIDSTSSALQFDPSQRYADFEDAARKILTDVSDLQREQVRDSYSQSVGLVFGTKEIRQIHLGFRRSQSHTVTDLNLCKTIEDEGGFMPF